jgi:hypothetical protein
VPFWQYLAYQNVKEIIELKSIDVEITLADIYLDFEKPV